MVDKSIVGTEMGGSWMMVERGKIREFAKAILDDNPAYEADDPAIPPTPTITPEPRSISPETPNEIAPTTAINVIVASDVACAR